MNSGTGFGFGSSNTGNNPWGSTQTTTNTNSFGFGANNTQPAGGFGGFGGNTNSAAGGGMFGQSNTGGFGQTNATANTNTNTGGFGGFGASNTNQGSSMFGGGNTNNNSMFGNNANTGSAFGMNNNQASAFGQSNNTSGGMFGQSNTGGFGQTNANTNTNTGGFGFGQTNTNNNSAFGSSNTGGFGQSNNTGGFGMGMNSMNNNTGFGANASGSMFGGSTELGTGHTAFKVTNEKDASNNPIVLQSISLMPVYKGYNFEELRWQDYQRGRRLPEAPGRIPNQYPEPTGMFAGSSNDHAFKNITPTGTATAPTNAAGGFGFGNTNTNTNTPANTGFGNVGGFGQTNTTNPGFGTSTSTGFGNSGGFGQTNNTGSAFGQNTQTQSTGFGNNAGFGMNTFGNTSQTKPGLFGSTTSNTTGGLLGNTNTNQTGGAFGNNQQNTNTGGLFGNNNTNTGFGFGNTNATTGTGFGATNTTANTGFGFGNTNTTNTVAPATGGFGTGATGGFGFGTSNTSNATAPTTGFGTGLNTNTTGTSLFGNTPNNTATSTGATGGFGFGTNNAVGTSTTGTSLFGNNAAKPSFGAGFGTSTATTGGLFGNTATNTNTAGTSLFGNNAAKPATSFSFGSNNTTGSLFGGNTSTSGFGATNPTSTFGNSTFGTAQPGTSSLFGNNAGAAMTNAAPIVAQVDKDIYGSNLATPETVATIFNSKITPSEKKNIPLVTPVESKPDVNVYQSSSSTTRFLPYRRPTSNVNLPGSFIPLTQNPIPISKRPSIAPVSKVYGRGIMPGFSDLRPISRPYFATRFVLKKDAIESSGIFNDSRNFFASSLSLKPTDEPKQNSEETTQNKGSVTKPVEVSASNDRTSFSIGTQVASSSTDSTESKYYTVPEMKELHKMSEEELSSLKNFKAGHRDFGEIEFLQEVSLTEISLSHILGDIITFKQGICTVYPDKSRKPPMGSGLNVPARITLYKCFPEPDADLPAGEYSEATIRKHVTSLTLSPDTEFIDYDKLTGKWTFQVAHFSTYGVPHLINALNQEENLSESTETELTINDSESLQTTQVDFQEDRLNVDHSPPFLPSNMPTPKRLNTGSSFSTTNPQHLYFASIELGLRKSFRVGWGPTNSIVFTNGYSINVGQYPAKSHSVTIIHNAFLAPNNDDHSFPASSLDESLQLTFNNSVADIIDDAPCMHPSSYLGFDTYLHSLGEGPLKGCLDQERNIWSLGGQLWGSKLDERIDRLEQQDQNQFDDFHSRNDQVCEWKSLAQKEKISEWWSRLVQPIVHQHEKMAQLNNADPLDLIWIYLTGHHVEAASDLALDTDNPRLSTLLIQCGGDQDLRHYIGLQIKSWHAEKCLEFIEPKRRKLYELLRGNMAPYKLPNGHWDEICHNLEWKRAFGMFLWYIGLYETDLKRCLDYYDRSLDRWLDQQEEEGVTCVGMKQSLPFPWYDTLNTFSYKKDRRYDILYHMLHLGVDAKYSLELLLHPLGISSNPLDFRLCWQLALILTRQIGIGVFTSSDNPTLCMDRITILFINQLLGLKMWRWALYVSLFLSNAKCRAQMIRDILSRNIEPEADRELQHMLQDDFQDTHSIDVAVSLRDLRIPPRWIEESLANLYNYQGRFRDELHLLVKVHKYDKAHLLFLSKLGPHMLMNRAYDEIVTLLEAFPAKKVKRWEFGAKYYLRLSQLMRQFIAIDLQAEQQDTEAVVALETHLQLLIADLNALEKSAGYAANARPEIDVKLRARMVDQVVDALTALRRSLGPSRRDDGPTQTPINLSRSRRIDQSLEMGRNFFDQN